MRRFHSRRLAGAIFALGLAALSVSVGNGHATTLHGVLMHPTVSDYVQVSASEQPPTNAQCFAATPVQRRCFTPQAIQASYNVGPLYDAGGDGRGVTIAIVDSYG